MARVNGLLNNFTVGEISPKLRRRVDIEGFAKANEFQQNFLSEPHGEMTFREGTEFLATAIRGTSTLKFIPFYYSETENYILEFSHNNETSSTHLRWFYGDGSGIALNYNEDIVSVEKRTDQVVVHWNPAGSSFYGPSYPSEITGLTVDGYSQYNFESIVPAAINFSALGGATHELVFTFTGTVASAAESANSGAKVSSQKRLSPGLNATGINGIQAVQQFGTMYATSNGQAVTKKIVRSSFGTLTIATAPFVDGAAANVFQSAGTYPRSIALHEGRLWLSGVFDFGSAYSGDVVFASDVGDYETFGYNAGTITAQTGLQLRLGESGGDITHLQSTKDFLYLQTLAGAHSLAAASGGNNPITAADFNFRKIHSVGSLFELPILSVNEDLFFVDRNKKKLRILDYNFDRNKYEPIDMSKHVEHLANFKIKNIWYTRGRVDRLYIATEDGEGMVVTYDATTNTNAWARYVPGDAGSGGTVYSNQTKASNGSSGTMPQLIDICSIFSGGVSQGEDNVFFASARGGASQTIYIEMKVKETNYLTPEAQFSGDETADTKIIEGDLKEQQMAAVFLDSAQSIVLKDTDLYDLTFANGGIVGDTNVTSGTAQFASTDVGRRIVGIRSGRVNGDEAPCFGIATVTAYNSTTNVDVTITEAFDVHPVVDSNYYFEALAGGYTFEVYGFAVGDTIGVVADGTDLGDYVIPASGQVTVTQPFSILHWGYRYKGLVKTTNLQGGGAIGPSDTHEKNVAKVGIKFRETNGCKVGSDPYNLETVVFAGDNDDMNAPTPVFNGEKIVMFEETWDTEKHIYIVKDDASSCTVQAIVPYMETSND